METLNDLNSSFVLNVLALPLFLCCLVMLLNRDHKEVSSGALKNTFATLSVYVFNTAALIFLLPNVTVVTSDFYDRIGIPTIDASIWDTSPVLLTLLVALLANDFSDYAIHRLIHTKWLWPTHAAHHTDTHVNAFTTFRVHVLETSLMAVSYVVLLTWLQIPAYLPVAVLIGRLHNMYVHMDLPYTHGPLNRVIASPAFHRWHHADTPKAYGVNLANMFSFYDVIFGTYSPMTVTDEPMGATNLADVNPLKIYAYPFMQWGRLLMREFKRMAGKTEPAPQVSTDVLSNDPAPVH